MPDPLPLSVAIARQVEGRWSGEVGHEGRDIAIIEARIRPLICRLKCVHSDLMVAVHQRGDTTTEVLSACAAVSQLLSEVDPIRKDCGPA